MAGDLPGRAKQGATTEATPLLSAAASPPLSDSEWKHPALHANVFSKITFRCATTPR